MGKIIAVFAMVFMAVVSVYPQGCDPAPAGLVAWWQAEGNAYDSIGNNNGTPTGGIIYTNGEVGQSFNFDGTGYIAVPASASLNLGTNGGFTIEGWIKPSADVNAPVIEWDSATTDGLQLWVANNNTLLFSNIKDTSGNDHTISFAYIFDTNNFQHVAVTYDKSSGVADLYLDGINVASANFGNITPQTTYPVNIGRRTGQPNGDGNTYSGLLDELSLYNRALSSNEIAGIYLAGSAGKCFTPAAPAILTQPQSQTNIIGGSANFSVVASGTPPLSYQWSFNTANIVSATNATLTLTNVQLNQAGNYSVTVSNIVGSANSASAVLTVVGVPPSITSQPASQTVLLGSNATFSVTASGTAPLSYQWEFGGTNILNATNATLALNNVQLSQAGSYSVLVTNIAGSTNSANAVLTVNLPPVCTPPPPGLVAWWQAEGNAYDSIGTNNGSPTGGITYTNGEVGQAFVFNHSTGYIPVPASPSLNLGTNGGLTIEAWVKPTANVNAPVVEWDSSSSAGLQLWVANNNTLLFANIEDTSGNPHTISFPYIFDTNNFQHVAVTYDKSSGLTVLYLNGAVVATNNFGSITPQTTYPVNIGRRFSNSGNIYGGLMDELSLYSRALSSNEIAAIYQAGSAGKCFTPVAPVITTQPQSQTNTLGGTATFSVTAGGTAPLGYQWKFGGTNILNATNTTLTLNNVQLTQAGNYSVTVSNIVGSTNSASAVLTVSLPPTCTTPPSGLVAWWQAEGNAYDSIGTNNGTPTGGISYTNGEVGQAFVFNHSTSYIPVPASPSLNLGTNGGLTIETWIQPDAYTVGAANGAGAPIIEWDSATQDGLELWVYMGSLFGAIRNTNAATTVSLQTASGLLNTSSFQHVAFTYDKSSGQAVIYLNGVVVATSNFGSITAQTACPVNIGRRTGQSYWGNSNYGGLIDELSVYSRALSSSEIAAIYNAGILGKCFTPMPPVILTQPQSQTNVIGGTASFSVAASGTAPVSYQWQFGGTNILNATNVSLTLTNLQLSQAGSYSVVLTNIAGSTNSANAVLTINVPVTCTPAPSGLISWWMGEGNGFDSIGANNATVPAGVTYATGEVGRAFNFNGTTNLTVADAPSLNPTNALTIEYWIYVSGRPAHAWTQNVFVKDGVTSGRQYFLTIGDSPTTSGAGDFRAAIGVPSGLQILDSQAVVQSNTWYHVAETYDGAALKLYVNGSLDSQMAVTGPIITTTQPIRIGGDAPAGPYYFNGMVDEISLYNRALSSNEIAAIYNAGTSGKCYTPVAPTITTQPTNQTVVLGGNATFSVAASGTAPVSYQWQFGGTNILNATNVSLTLTSVQLSQAGNYSVTVSNIVGLTNSIAATLTVTVPVCTPAPSGLVSWWQAEGNAHDNIGNNNGTQIGGIAYTNGEVGQAFVFNHSSSYITVPASASLNIGTNGGFTIEGWIKPDAYTANVGNGAGAPIIEWDSASANGVSIWAGEALIAFITDTSGNNHILQTTNFIFSTNNWQHMAVTYDKSSGNAVLYYNAIAVVTNNFGSFTPQTSYPMNIGRRTAAEGANGNTYSGLIDELSFYNRALSSNEVASIYNAGSGGKCFSPVAPAITTQPTNQTVILGRTVNFSVAASGTPPLSYQWSFNGTNILNATNVSLTLANVQLSQAGNYSVVVSNIAGSTNSVAATLTVTVPVCTPAPSGLVSWWQAEGNGYDSVGTNNATVPAGVTYASGEAGQAFNFNGTTTLTVADAPSLDPTNALTIEYWVYVRGKVNGIWTQNVFDKDGATSSRQYLLTVGDSPTTIGSGDFRAGVGVSSGLVYFDSVTAVQSNTWYHVAETYDGAALKLYVNGSLDTQMAVTGPIITTTQPVRIGGDAPAGPYYFNGMVDEISLYNRALSSNEIAAIYNAGASGKCYTPVAPTITTQPTNQTVVLGGNATFSVAASGTAPVSYQWQFGGTNILNATNVSLTLTSVQLSQAGNYSVTVSNIVGLTNSIAATLTVDVPVCTAATSALVAWWQAEGNANDSIGNNNGSPTDGITYTNGEVGQAFVFNDTTSYIPVPASPSLDIGANGSGVTIEAWIKPDAITVNGWGAPIIEWDSATAIGLHFHCYMGSLYANIVDTSGVSHGIQSASGVFSTINFQHVALTYDKSSGQAILYLNGAIVATNNFGTIIPQTTYPANIGRRTTGYNAGANYGGLIDELSLYNRALSSNEIAAIYNAGSAGKCFTPVAPAITTKPTNQTVAVGQTATFAVAASGTAPVSYQWSLNGTNITGATNPTLTLNNVQLTQAGSYSVVVTNIVGSTNSASAVLTVVLPPVITQQPQSASVSSYNSASFTVFATGTGPLTYQWRKNGTNLVDGGNVSGSATTNLILASVSLGDAGNYDVVVSNPYATTNSAVAVLTVPQTVLTLVSTNVMSGTTVVVPVLMNALGVESLIQASVGYDPTKLVLQHVLPGPAAADASFLEVDKQTNNGYVGFAIYEDSTQPAGTNEEVADLVFSTLPVTNNATVNLTFGDNPSVRGVVDNDANSLPAIYQNGTLVLSPAEYEADVSPRPTGDHQVGPSDWVEVGRMVAGLDTPTNSDEMLRADCAPRNAPDGILTVADWVQAGRYESGLDPLTLVTPPPAPSLLSLKSSLSSPSPTRTLQIGTVSVGRGQTVSVPVLLVCATNENAVGMTIGYDVSRLKFLNATLGSAIVGGKINVNTNHAAGEVGVALAMPIGQSLAAGTNQVALLQFAAMTNASGPVVLSLDGTVVKLQLADKTANVLAASYVNGAVNLPPQPVVTTVATGTNLQLTWQIASGTFQVESATSPVGPWITNTASALSFVTNGANVTVTVTATNAQQYFRLIGQ